MALDYTPYKSLQECEVMGYDIDFNNMIILEEHGQQLQEESELITDLNGVKEMKYTLDNTKQDLIIKLKNFRKICLCKLFTPGHIQPCSCCKAHDIAIALAMSWEETQHHFKIFYSPDPMTSNANYHKLYAWWVIMTGWEITRTDDKDISCLYNGFPYGFRKKEKISELIKEFGGDLIIK